MMNNNRHLPAQHGGYDPNRRQQRPYNHHNQHSHSHSHAHQQSYQAPSPMYNGYINPYATFQPQYPMPQMPHAPYSQYGAPYQPYPQPTYARSPPPQYQQYAAPQVVSSHPRPHQSPAIVSSPYKQPPPLTPSSTSSSTNNTRRLSIPSVSTIPSQQVKESLEEVQSATPPFQAPLPWSTHPNSDWPTRPPRTRRRKKIFESKEEPVALPSKTTTAGSLPGHVDTPRADTPSTTQPSSDNAPSTTPTTPTSAQRDVTTPKASAAQPLNKAVPKPSPTVPIVPAMPKSTSRPTSSKSAGEQNSVREHSIQDPAIALSLVNEPEAESIQDSHPDASSAPSGPVSWANLFKGAKPSAVANGGTSEANGTARGPLRTSDESLADTMREFNASMHDAKLAFLKPRGLVNSGNMCYMNSVLQVLVFCIPFYDFLDQVSKKMAHSFKSDTPLIDSMIMFMKEFPTITSADSMDQLRRQLRGDDIEKYGDALRPDHLYEVMAKSPRFSTMEKGHQQDAEEFLGFLLDGLHEECLHVMSAAATSNATSSLATPTNVPSSPTTGDNNETGDVFREGDGWLEVGRKQRAATTRVSGISLESPVSKIFGGKLRSELKMPSQKLSVTMEPFQPLQLDIGGPDIRNIVDALKSMTTAEKLSDDFGGVKSTAVKHVLIETLPPVLILHLKRFHFDNTGAQKIWKKVGYPLELEMPREVFTKQKQNAMLNHGGLPKYRLIGVVYHHGKNASGGHYTVDVRRQDGNEWIRLDDTVIRRVSSADVADGGSEEDPKKLAQIGKPQNKKDNMVSGNIFEQIKDDDGEESGQDEWKQVNGVSSSASGKKWSSVANGASRNKSRDISLKDNKVAYLLFYQKI